MAAFTNSNLFQWKKRADLAEYLSASNKKSKLGLWVDRVQQVSDEASKKLLQLHTSSSFPVDDEAVFEAHKLLEDWKKDASILVSEQDIGFNTVNHASTSRCAPGAKKNCFSEIKEDQSSLQSMSEHASIFKNNNVGYEIDEALLIKEVLSNMRELDISKDVPLDLKPLKVKDYSLNMNIRQTEVKARNEARREKALKLKNDLLAKNDVKEQARKRIQQEEEICLKAKRKEEDNIKMQMIKIKKELADEKKLRQNEFQRHQEVLIAAKLEILKELKIKKEEELLERQKNKEAEEKRRQQIKMKFQEQSIKQMMQNVKILQCHFSAWYNLMIKRRVGVAEMRQNADYKCMVRSWHAWRAYIVLIKFNAESQTAKAFVSDVRRKRELAINHHSQKLLRDCFLSWLSYTRLYLQKKKLLQEHKQKAEKMAKFLEASNTFLLKKAKCSEDFEDNMLQVNESAKHKPRNTRVSDEESHDSRTAACALSNEANCSNRSSLSSNTASSKFDQNENKELPIENLQQPKENIVNDQHKKKSKHSNSGVNKTQIQNACKNMESIQKQSVDIKPPTGSFQLKRTRSDVFPAKQTNPLIKAMEEREKKRKERKELVEAEKRKKEEERLKELRRQQNERELEEQREKQEKIRVKNEEKKLKAQKERERLLRIEELRVKRELAVNHFNKVLLRKYGLQPLKKIVELTRINMEIGTRHSIFRLSRVVLLEWDCYVKAKIHDRVVIADRSYNKLLMRRCFDSLLKYRVYRQSLMDSAENHSIQRIIKHAFKVWQIYVTDERVLMWGKENSATDHNTLRLLKKYFACWITFVKDQANERVREMGRELLRKKVQLWLPDYAGKTQLAEMSNNFSI